jgi:dihydroorotate dehydrogenase electron transfer subunit
VQVSLEVRMACGLGVCYGCSIKTKGGMKKVCRDGPVFSMQEVAWEELAGL